MKKAFKIIIPAVLSALLLLVSCGSNSSYDPPDPLATLESVDVNHLGDLVFNMSDGTVVTAGKLPSNSEGIKLTDANIIEGKFYVFTSDGYRISCGTLPTFGDGNSLYTAMINSKGELVFNTSKGEHNQGRLYLPTVPKSPLTPSGASEYAQSRDTSGRNTATVEMKIKGYGTITLLLDATAAPKTVENFISLAKSGFYNGLTFHRIIENFMIQGGDPDADGTGSSENKIYGEFAENGHASNDISHKRGTISMARGNDMNSASCQFFICNADSTFLDGSYAAFGYVLNGMNIVDEITNLTIPYANPYYSDTIQDTAKQAVIESITVVEDMDPLS